MTTARVQIIAYRNTQDFDVFLSQNFSINPPHGNRVLPAGNYTLTNNNPLNSQDYDVTQSRLSAGAVLATVGVTLDPATPPQWAEIS